MDYSGVEALADRWREEATLLRRRGAGRQADALESCAEDLERRLPEWRLELLTVEEAARESGYSKSQLYQLLSKRDDLNAGEPGAPRIRRCDIPRKAGHDQVEIRVEGEDGPVERDEDGEPDLAGHILGRDR